MFQLQSWQECMMLHTQSFKKQYLCTPWAILATYMEAWGRFLQPQSTNQRHPEIEVILVWDARHSGDYGRPVAAAVAKNEATPATAPPHGTAWTAARRIDAYYLSSCLVFVVERTSRQTKGNGGQLLHNMQNCYWFRTSTFSHTHFLFWSHTYFRTCMCVRIKMSAHTNSLQILYDQNAFEITPNNYFKTFLPSVSSKVLKSELNISCWNRMCDFRKMLTPVYCKEQGKKVERKCTTDCMLFAVSRHIGWMPSTTTTMWLHFYCIEDGAWIADRFLVVLPPRWRVVWTFLRPIGAKSVLKSHLNFCAQGDSISFLPCLSIFLPLREHFLLWNVGKNRHRQGYPPCLVHMVLINPHP